FEIGDDTGSERKLRDAATALQRSQDFERQEVCAEHRLRIELPKKADELAIRVFGEPPPQRGELAEAFGVVGLLEEELVQLRSVLHQLDVSLGISPSLQLRHEIHQINALDLVNWARRLPCLFERRRRLNMSAADGHRRDKDTHERISLSHRGAATYP